MKRAFDLAICAPALLVATPVMVVLAILVRIYIGKPALFRQQRAGLHGKPFELFKFRTMADRRSADGQLLPDGQRLSKLGRMLRSSSLDELPQLWNVLRGDMSLVGPRPLLMQYLPLYDAEQRRRHELRPGLTGLAQVNGRNALTWNDKFAKDVWYVDNQGLWLDCRILWATLHSVISRRGISAEDEATMAPFTGSEQ